MQMMIENLRNCQWLLGGREPRECWRDGETVQYWFDNWFKKPMKRRLCQEHAEELEYIRKAAV